MDLEEIKVNRFYRNKNSRDICSVLKLNIKIRYRDIDNKKEKFCLYKYRDDATFYICPIEQFAEEFEPKDFKII